MRSVKIIALTRWLDPHKFQSWHRCPVQDKGPTGVIRMFSDCFPLSWRLIIIQSEFRSKWRCWKFLPDSHRCSWHICRTGRSTKFWESGSKCHWVGILWRGHKATSIWNHNSGSRRPSVRAHICESDRTAIPLTMVSGWITFTSPRLGESVVVGFCNTYRTAICQGMCTFFFSVCSNGFFRRWTLDVVSWEAKASKHVCQNLERSINLLWLHWQVPLARVLLFWNLLPWLALRVTTDLKRLLTKYHTTLSTTPSWQSLGFLRSMESQVRYWPCWEYNKYSNRG